jgi:hypothetical protein
VVKAALWGIAMGLAGQAASAPQQAAAPASPVAEKASVCEVARAGAVYSGHYVELTGVVAGHDPEHLLLTSGDCILGLKMVFSPEVQTHEDIRVLFAAVKRNASAGASGGTDSGITGTFEGKYTYTDDAAGGQFLVDGIDQLNFPKR